MCFFFFRSSSLKRMIYLIERVTLQNTSFRLTVALHQCRQKQWPKSSEDKVESALVSIPSPRLHLEQLWDRLNNLDKIFLLLFVFRVWACFDFLCAFLGCNDWAWIKGRLWQRFRLLTNKKKMLLNSLKHLLIQLKINICSVVKSNETEIRSSRILLESVKKCLEILKVYSVDYLPLLLQCLALYVWNSVLPFALLNFSCRENCPQEKPLLSFLIIFLPLL